MDGQALRREADREFRLHNSLAFWLCRLVSSMQDQFNQRLESHGVTWPQWMVLNALYYEAAATPAEVAAYLGVDRSAITRLVDRLEAKSLVERHHDGLDRRSIKLLLTRQGKTLMPQLCDLAKDHQEAFLENLHPTEYRQFKTNLQKMLRVGGIDSQNLWKLL